MRSQQTASVQVIGKATHFMKETGILTVMVSIDHPELAAKLSEFMRRRSGFGLCSYHTLVTSPWGEDNPNVKREHIPDAAMCCIRPEYSFQLSNTVVVAEMSFLNKGKLINIEDAAGIQFEESDLAPSDFAHFSFASFMQVQSPEDLAHQAIVDSAKKFEMNVGYQSSTVISCTEFKDANDLRYQLVSRAKRFWVVCVALEPDQKTNSTMCYE